MQKRLNFSLMIRYLHNCEIDKVKWDNCVGADCDSLPYGTSWYLDIMSPGWDALVDGDYSSVFPIPHKRKFGISYIYTPVFLQKLGLYSNELKSLERLEEFIRFIPDKYALTDLCISGRPQNFKGKIVSRDNYELPLSDMYENLVGGYTSDCRRNLKLAETDCLEFPDNFPVNEAVHHFLHGVGEGIKGIKPDSYINLKSLMNFAINNGYGEIRGVYYKSTIIFAMLILKYRNRIIPFLISTSIESKNRRTGYFVIDSIIKQYAGGDYILDFAGSSIPGVASFNRSFGSVNIPYSRLFHSKLPRLISRFKE